MEPDRAIELINDALEKAVFHPVLILSAKWILAEYDRDEIPDWVEALANANIENWKSAIAETLRLKLAEDEELDNASDTYDN